MANLLQEIWKGCSMIQVKAAQEMQHITMQESGKHI